MRIRGRVQSTQTSFDVSSIISCSMRGTDAFRISFQRGRDTKVYDFETPEAGTPSGIGGSRADADADAGSHQDAGSHAHALALC